MLSSFYNNKTIDLGNVWKVGDKDFHKVFANGTLTNPQ
jgi:hypothetical protein